MVRADDSWIRYHELRRQKAEEELLKVMPYMLQTTDRQFIGAKLAIKTAREAGVDEATVAAAEAKLQEAEEKATFEADATARKEAEELLRKDATARTDAEERLREAMPLPMQTADPVKLAPAIAAARAAGVAAPTVWAAEAKLKEAEAKAKAMGKANAPGGPTMYALRDVKSAPKARAEISPLEKSLDVREPPMIPSSPRDVSSPCSASGAAGVLWTIDRGYGGQVRPQRLGQAGPQGTEEGADIGGTHRERRGGEGAARQV